MTYDELVAEIRSYVGGSPEVVEMLETELQELAEELQHARQARRNTLVKDPRLQHACLVRVCVPTRDTDYPDWDWCGSVGVTQPELSWGDFISVKWTLETLAQVQIPPATVELFEKQGMEFSLYQLHFGDVEVIEVLEE